MRSLLFVAGRQLWARKLLNGLAIVSVMLGVFPIIAISGILRGFQGKFVDTILKNTPHVVLTLRQPGESPGAAFTLEDAEPEGKDPQSLMAEVERVPGVARAAGSVSGMALLRLAGRAVPVEVRGVEPARQDETTPLKSNLTEGDFGAFAASADGLLIGAGVARELKAKVGDRVRCVSATGGAAVLTISGVFETTVNLIDKTLVYLPLAKAQALFERTGQVDRIEVRLKDPGQADALAADLAARFSFPAESWRHANANFLGLFDQQNLIISFVLSALLAVGGFGILAIQVMIVLQKRRDIALLRSVGFRGRDVLLIFLFQGLMVAAAGSLLGAVEGHLVLDLLRHTKVDSGETFLHAETWIIWESPIQYLLAVSFALVVGLLSSAFPAWQASQVEPVDVLRGQS